MTPNTTQHSRPDWALMLRDMGLRVTHTRVAVLDILHGHPHSSAEEIVRLAGQAPGRLSVQTVYNVLADLGRHRLVRSIELPNQPGRFEVDVQDNHHHALCTGCGLLTDVPCAVGHRPCLTPPDGHGIQIDVADVLYRGLCEACSLTR